MTALERLQLCTYWLQKGNKWVEIAKLMGRTENWVKNNWKKVLKRESIIYPKSVEDLRSKVAAVTEKLRTAVGSIPVQTQRATDSRLDLSSPDVAEELALSDSETSKLPMGEMSSVRVRSGEHNMEETKHEHWIPDGSDDLNAMLMDPEDAFGIGSSPEDPPALNEKPDPGAEVGVGGPLNTESDEYDFSAMTQERQLASGYIELDIHKYTVPSQCKSPFTTWKRTII